MTGAPWPHTIPAMAHRSQVADTAVVLTALFGTRPFSHCDALAAGISRGHLPAAVAAGVVIQLRTGAHAVAGTWESDPREQHLMRARAVQLAVPASIACHWTAALAHRLPAPTRRDSRPQIPTLLHPNRSGLTDDARFVEGLVDPRDVVTIGDLVATSVPRTALDVAVGRPLPHALVVLDAAARLVAATQLPADTDLVDALESEDLRLATLATLGAAESRRTDRTGARQVTQAIALADPRSESALESWSRAVFHTSALPVAQPQFIVRGERGLAYRADFAWPDRRVLGEADGMGKYQARATLLAEKRREDDLRRAGWIVVRWTWAEVTRTPEVVVARVARALGE